MSTHLLTLYLLIWPLMALGVLTVLCVALYKDIKATQANGDDLV